MSDLDCRRRSLRFAPAAFSLVVALAAGAPALAQSSAAASCASAPRATRGVAPLATFGYDRGEPLDLRDSLVGVENGLAVHRVSFASPRGGRATGLLLVPTEPPRGPGKRAGVVILHGAPGDGAGMRFIADPVARRGAVVLAVDAPFARRDPGDPLALTARDSADQVQYIVDLQRGVDLLLARRDVDPARLGAVGVSYGGAMGALLAGVERRIRAYALAVADGGPAAHFTRADGTRMEPFRPVSAAQWCGWFEAMEPIAPIHFVGRAAPARLLFLWGRRDPLVPPYLAEALWRTAPETKEARWYDSEHALPPAAYETDMMTWLDEQLGLGGAAGAGRPARGTGGAGR